MTKNAFSAISSAVKNSSSAVIAGRRVSRYFEEVVWHEPNLPWRLAALAPLGGRSP